MAKKNDVETAEVEEPELKPAEVQPAGRAAGKGGSTKLTLDRIRAKGIAGMWYEVSELATKKSSASTASRLRRTVKDMDFTAVGTKVLARVPVPEPEVDDDDDEGLDQISAATLAEWAAPAEGPRAPRKASRKAQPKSPLS